jgi:hypothetical protein
VRALAVVAAAFSLGVALAPSARAEENRWNINLELGPNFTVTQPDKANTSDRFGLTGVHLRAAIEYSFLERVAAEVAYSPDLLFHQTGGGLAVQQVIVAGARVRLWWSKTGGYFLPRPPPLKSHPLSINDLLSDAWVDAHLGVALQNATRFDYDVGVGARFALISPLQLGLFVRYQQMLGGGDMGPSFKQVMFGLTASVGFLPVHAEADSDGDGVPDSLDKCPGTGHGVEVNLNGCEIRESETKEPKCSDTDLDGVCDGSDDCPDTKAGVSVDKHGCPTGGAQEPPPAAE